MNIDKLIKEAYENKKRVILETDLYKDPDAILENIFDLWMYMTRYRNCDLGSYFDEEIHKCIKRLNPIKKRKENKFQKKNKFRIAYVLSSLSDTGGASITHRFMLPNGKYDDFYIKNYLLVSNFACAKNLEETEMYRYAVENLNLSEIKILKSDLSYTQKGHQIENWLYEKKIDFCITEPDPIILYALASKPVAVTGILSQDCYCYTLGPGFGDLTFLVTTDQVFKYRSKLLDPDAEMKVLMLPLHDSEYIEGADPLDRDKLGVPNDAIVSGSTNMWKSFFGDSETLIEGIAELIRANNNYHHIFLGTPRCLDNLEFFLNKNPDIKDNVHYAGPVKNIYRVLKSLDFWINSFPTSGGTDIEAALVGIPSIEFVANRNLDLHPVEFLRTRECDVLSLDEFVALGNRLISDEEYRKDLGKYLNSRITREFDKEKIIREKIYGSFIELYGKKLIKSEERPKIKLEQTIEYEKKIAYFNIHLSKEPKEKSYSKSRQLLNECIHDFPDKPFGWIKSFEQAINDNDKKDFYCLAKKFPSNLLKDYRIHVMLAIGYERFGDIETAIQHSREGMHLAIHDNFPCRLAIRLLANGGYEKEALVIINNFDKDKLYTRKNLKYFLAEFPDYELPLYYNY